MMRYCCWNSCIRLRLVLGPDVEPQVTRRPPRLSAQQRAVEGFGAYVLEHTSTHFLPGDLARHVARTGRRDN